MSFSNGSGALLLSDAGVAGSLIGEIALLDSIPDVTLAADQFTAVSARSRMKSKRALKSAAKLLI